MEPKMDVLARFRQAVSEFDQRVHAIGPAEWEMPTPNSEWTVRDLVQHLVSEMLWVVPLLEGKTIADVGDALDGDLLGSDPVSAWAMASAQALAAAEEEGVAERTVHLSFGDFPAATYFGQLTSDNAIHAWDLARAINADDSLDAGLVEFVWVYLGPQAEEWRKAGAFGPRVDVAASADRLTQLLALAGRRR